MPMLYRRLQNEIDEHLRKGGYLPERQKRQPTPKVKLADFVAQDHHIGSIASNTLWKVYHVLDGNSAMSAYITYVLGVVDQPNWSQVYNQLQATYMPSAYWWSCVGGAAPKDYPTDCDYRQGLCRY